VVRVIHHAYKGSHRRVNKLIIVFIDSIFSIIVSFFSIRVEVMVV